MSLGVDLLSIQTCIKVLSIRLNSFFSEIVLDKERPAVFNKMVIVMSLGNECVKQCNFMSMGQCVERDTA